MRISLIEYYQKKMIANITRNQANTLNIFCKKNQAARNAATKLIAILQNLGQQLFKEVNLENSLIKYLNFKI